LLILGKKANKNSTTNSFRIVICGQGNVANGRLQSNPDSCFRNLAE
jgi:hypothetical protein